MTYYIRYAVVDDKTITLPEIEKGLQQVSPGYEIDSDLLVLDDVEYGQVDIVQPGHSLFVDDLELMKKFADQKENKVFLLTVLQKATSIVIVQAIWSKSDSETLKAIEKMFEWLMRNYAGILMDEGGVFYENFSKPIS